MMIYDALKMTVAVAHSATHDVSNIYRMQHDFAHCYVDIVCYLVSKEYYLVLRNRPFTPT